MEIHIKSDYTLYIEDFPMRKIIVFSRIHKSLLVRKAGKIRFSIYISLLSYNIISTRVSCVNR